MRDSPAPSAAASSVTALYCAPPSGRADLFLPGTAGDFSLSASLSACTLLYEVPSRTGAQDRQRASERAGRGAGLPAGRRARADRAGAARRAPGSARLAPPGPARCAPGDPLPPPDPLAPGPAAGVADTAAPATRVVPGLRSRPSLPVTWRKLRQDGGWGRVGTLGGPWVAVLR